MDSNALEVMKTMNQYTYTYVPVLEDGVVVGVFSENVVFSYLVKHEIAAVDADITIGEFGEFLPLDKHPSEFFKFVGKDALLIDVQELFKNELEADRRLGVVHITNSGKSTEKLLGMITSWDIAGKIV